MAGDLLLPGGRPAPNTFNPLLHAMLKCPCGSEDFVQEPGGKFYVESGGQGRMLSQPLAFWRCKLCRADANFPAMAEAALASGT